MQQFCGPVQYVAGGDVVVQVAPSCLTPAELDMVMAWRTERAARAPAEGWRRDRTGGAEMSMLRGSAALALVACLMSGAAEAQRQLYKCVENGKVIYSERKVCAEPAPRDASRAAAERDVPPDGVNMAAEIQAEFERELAAKRAAQDTQRATAAAAEAARAKAAADCETELGRPAAVVNSAWDGSVWQAEHYLKRYYLRDPKSYASVGWGPVVRACSGYTVRGTFRARNGFGGMTVETAVFEFDRAGNVIDMVRQ